MDCGSLAELDELTSAVGLAHVGSVAVEGSTFVVASGQQKLPPPRPRPLVSLGPSPDLSKVERVVLGSIAERGAEAVAAFNRLTGPVQLALLGTLAELSQELETRPWDDIRDEGVRSAIEAYVAASLQLGESEGTRPAGAVIEMAAAVEGYAKHALRVLIEGTYGRDFARAQKELKLPSKDLRRLTLGKALTALRVMKSHSDFEHAADLLDDEQLDTLAKFTELRNRWAHTAVPPGLSAAMVVREAGGLLVVGIRLLRWIAIDILVAVTPLDGGSDVGLEPPPDVTVGLLPAEPADRRTGIFVSHSSEDRELAERVATALKALNYNVWYADWAISPGDSIVRKISSALAQNDTLVILLSPRSVSSRWVQKELSVALMLQLKGQNVRIIPILIEDCDIPKEIHDIKYVDMSVDFQDGFVQLLKVLGQKG